MHSRCFFLHLDKYAARSYCIQPAASALKKHSVLRELCVLFALPTVMQPYAILSRCILYHCVVR